MSGYAVIPDAFVKRDSGKALCCIVGNKEPWIPRSQLDRIYPIGYRGPINVSRWWLGKSGNQDLVGAPPPEPEPNPVIITADDLPHASALKRKLAFKYHPDRAGGNAEMMRDINSLWQEIMNDLRSNSR
jgi:hypothetical protein